MDLGFSLYETWGRGVNGWALVVQGEGKEGVRQIDQGLLEPLDAWFTEGFDTADLTDAEQLAKILA